MTQKAKSYYSLVKRLMILDKKARKRRLQIRETGHFFDPKIGWYVPEYRSEFMELFNQIKAKGHLIKAFSGKRGPKIYIYRL